ncbi:NYN domain-containing protein [Mycoplasmatota bacterium zrk1]
MSKGNDLFLVAHFMKGRGVMITTEKNIALLIDAENIPAKYIDIIIDEANKQGTVNIRRIYGDWTNNQLHPWKDKCLEHGLSQIQQYSYTPRKNSSDFSLVIDAMDILYRKKVDSFCIVSSDSDFTKLVTRLKEDNIYVFGLGESKTPLSLVNACETFSYLDKMIPMETITKKTEEKKDKSKTTKVKSGITPLKTIHVALSTLVNENSNENGWAHLSLVAVQLRKKYPAFHPRNYGKDMKFMDFLRKTEKYEFKKMKSVMYIKIVRKKKKVA